MSEKQAQIMRAMNLLLEQLKAEHSAFRFAIDFQPKTTRVVERTVVQLELETQRNKAGDTDLSTAYIESLERVLAIFDEKDLRLIPVTSARIAGKIEALEFAIQHSGNLEKIDDALLDSIEILEQQKEHMSAFASPRLVREGYIDGLFQAQKLIQQILSQ